MPLRAAQCKCHEAWKTLPPAEIEDEVNKAKSFEEPIGVYAILTTAKVSAAAQQMTRRLNREHKKAGLFQIELYNWDQIKELLNQYKQIATEIYDLPKNEQLTAIQQGLSSVCAVLDVIRDEKGGEGFHAGIDSAKQHIEQHDYQMARLICQQLRSRHWDKLDKRQRFRLLANLGGAYLGEGELERAARFFWEAKPYQPDDEKACANEALGFQLTRNPEKAFELADKYRIQFPTSARILGIWVRNSPTSKGLEDLTRGCPAFS